jgi:hypothetical protein
VKTYQRIYRLLPILILAGCADPTPPACDAPPLVHCWTIQLDPNSSRITRVCADPDDAQPVGWWRT